MNLRSLEMEINFHMVAFKGFGRRIIYKCVCFPCVFLHTLVGCECTYAQTVLLCVLVSLCVGFYVLSLCPKNEQVWVCL